MGIHGTSICVNIQCDGEKVMLVDLDWGGNGEVPFPGVHLKEELFDVCQVSGDVRTRKQFDIRASERMLAKACLDPVITKSSSVIME
jgi:hypothetical protein